MMAVLPGILRVFLALWLLLGAMWFGANGHGPWTIFGLAAVFTVAFGIGRWRAWIHSWQNGKMARAFAGQLGTYAAQSVLCALLFLAGRGIGSFAGGSAAVNLEVDTLSRLVWWGVIAILPGLLLIFLEMRSGVVSGLPSQPDPMPEEQADNVTAYETVQTPSVPVTQETFFRQHNYRNVERSGTYGQPDYVRRVIPEKAFLTEAQIDAEEAQLGMTLPPLLRALYLRQNGGSGMSLYAQATMVHHNVEDGWIEVFSGYDDMERLTDMRSLKSAISDYAYFEDEPERFPGGSENMFILAQWYRETLFLDYRGAKDGAPRVGFCDFDAVPVDDLRDPAWEEHAAWWVDFETFFNSLRRRPEDLAEDI